MHAMVSAGWIIDSDGKQASFQQVAESLLAPMGVTKGHIRRYLSKAYDQKNWREFAEELARQADRYNRKRLQR